MPNRSSKAKSQKSKLRNVDQDDNSFSFDLSEYTKYLPSKKVAAVILIVGLVILGLTKKNLFIAGLINGSPITNLELQQRLNEQFRTQVLNQIIDEKIVLQEAKKQDIVVLDAEVQAKIAQLEARFGGSQVLDNLLNQQGQTRNSIKNQLKVQIAVEKLYDKEATLSAEEVDEFVNRNKKQLQSTDSASQKLEAAAIIKQQRLSQIVKDRFQSLKQKAKIQIF